MSYELAMDAAELSAYVSEVFPQANRNDYRVERLEPGKIVVGMTITDEHLRPGGTVSGPTMFSIADCASYLLVLGHIGKVALAVTTNLNINFLSKPEGDIFAEAKFLKLGKRLAVCDIEIMMRKDRTLVSHATCTYSIPPRN